MHPLPLVEVVSAVHVERLPRAAARQIGREEEDGVRALVAAGALAWTAVAGQPPLAPGEIVVADSAARTLFGSGCRATTWRRSPRASRS